MKSFLSKLTAMMEMVKFEHTIFALPFALIGMLYASADLPNGLPHWQTIVWIVTAMVGARTCAMAFNRIADRVIDSANPRTQNRALPAGKVSLTSAIALMIGSIALFLYSAWQLNLMCFILSPVALIIIMAYSYTKRFTSLSHLWLGISLGIAPTAAWIAVRGIIEYPPIALSAAVMFWTAGFDILYSLQDIEFDHQFGLYSIPRKFGIDKSLWLARAFHLLAVVFLILAGTFFNASIFYYAGTAVAAGLLTWEHCLIKSNDLSRINTAFFTINGWVSAAMLCFVLADRFISKAV